MSTMCLQCPRRPEEGVRATETEVTGGPELLLCLGTEPESSLGTASAIDARVIPPAHSELFKDACGFLFCFCFETRSMQPSQPPGHHMTVKS